MIQKPKGKKSIAKAVKAVKPAKKFTSAERTIDKSGAIKKSKDMANDEAYDRGFNDGYSKGLEDSGLDESR